MEVTSPKAFLGPAGNCGVRPYKIPLSELKRGNYIVLVLACDSSSEVLAPKITPLFVLFRLHSTTELRYRRLPAPEQSCDALVTVAFDRMRSY